MATLAPAAPSELAKARPPLEWDKIRADALDGLNKSKDLRLLAYLGTASLRTDGLPAFAGVLTTASKWLETYWPQVYPALDERSAAILRTIRAAAPASARLLVIGQLIEPPNQGAPAKLSDLNMLVSPGGRERRREEFAVLFAAGGFALTGVHAAGRTYVIEGVLA